MSLETTINQDLKTAMLAKDEHTVSTLRLLKSTLLYAKVAAGTRDSEMSDDDVITILAKEAKKRQESADLYMQGGNSEKAAAELAEKVVIERYLPAQLSEDEVRAIVDEVVAELGVSEPSQMGQVIGRVKQKTGAAADGALVARLVKERISA
jgi:uncharacterized protein YqeY